VKDNKLNNIILDNNKAVADLQLTVMDLKEEVAALKKAIKYIFQKYNLYNVTDEKIHDFINRIMREE
jgi:hypothetical protein